MMLSKTGEGSNYTLKYRKIILRNAKAHINSSGIIVYWLLGCCCFNANTSSPKCTMYSYKCIHAWNWLRIYNDHEMYVIQYFKQVSYANKVFYFLDWGNLYELSQTSISSSPLKRLSYINNAPDNKKDFHWLGSAPISSSPPSKWELFENNFPLSKHFKFPR